MQADGLYTNHAARTDAAKKYWEARSIERRQLLRGQSLKLRGAKSASTLSRRMRCKDVLRDETPVPQWRKNFRYVRAAALAQKKTATIQSSESIRIPISQSIKSTLLEEDLR